MKILERLRTIPIFLLSIVFIALLGLGGLAQASPAVGGGCYLKGWVKLYMGNSLGSSRGVPAPAQKMEDAVDNADAFIDKYYGGGSINRCVIGVIVYREVHKGVPGPWRTEVHVYNEIGDQIILNTTPEGKRCGSGKKSKKRAGGEIEADAR